MGLVLLDDCEDRAFAGYGMDLGPGRNGNGFQFNDVGGYCTYYYSSHSPYGTGASPALNWTFGFAIRPLADGGQANPIAVTIGTNYSYQVWVALNVDGSITVRRGSQTAPSIAQSAPGVMSLGAWAYFEMQVVCSTTAGSVSVRVNNTVVCSATNVNTTASSGPDPTGYWGFVIGMSSSTSQKMLAVVDDVYVCQGTGSTPDPFLGDLVVEGLNPNGDGAVNQWLGSDGNSANNWQLVAGTTSGYTKDAVVGHQDLYNLTPLSLINGTVVGVWHMSVVSKSDAGPTQFRLVNHGNTDTKSPIFPMTGTGTGGYYFGLGFTVNPETGAPFTLTEVNALQSGVEVA